MGWHDQTCTRSEQDALIYNMSCIPIQEFRVALHRTCHFLLAQTMSRTQAQNMLCCTCTEHAKPH